MAADRLCCERAPPRLKGPERWKCSLNSHHLHKHRKTSSVHSMVLVFIQLSGLFASTTETLYNKEISHNQHKEVSRFRASGTGCSAWTLKVRERGTSFGWLAIFCTPVENMAWAFFRCCVFAEMHELGCPRGYSQPSRGCSSRRSTGFFCPRHK